MTKEGGNVGEAVEEEESDDLGDYIPWEEGDC